MEPQAASTLPSLLHLHFENSVDGQYVLDPDADIFIKVNPAMCELLGFSAEQLVEARRPIASLSIVHPDDREVVSAQRKLSNSVGELNVMRFRTMRADGDVRHLEVRYCVISHQGRTLHVGSATDVSEQAKLENKLRAESDYNRQLSLAAQSAAKESQRKQIEVSQANSRESALSEVLRAIPVLTKRLLEIESIHDVFRQAALTLVNDAQFSQCVVLLLDPAGELEIAYANPSRGTVKIRPDSNPLYESVLRGQVPIAVDSQQAHVAAIRTHSAVRGLLHVGMPRSLAPFFSAHGQTQESIRDLVLTIADFLGVVLDNHENLARIKEQSRQDRLTGLFNRRVFDEQLVIEFRRALRYERDLSLMIFDLDNFKRINDTWGHLQGDRVLEVVSRLLKGSFRDLDTVCRYGGEEICVIMPETVGEAARVKAEQIRRKIAETDIALTDDPGKHINVTVSVGIACIDKSTQTEQQLLRAADRALYYCKNHGKNQVRLSEDGDAA